MSSRNDALVPYPVKGGTQTASFLISSVAITTAIGAHITRVSLYATQDCFVRFDVAPTATSADFFLPASTRVMLAIRPGEKVAAIRLAVDGILYVSELDY